VIENNKKKADMKHGRANGHGTLEKSRTGIYLARWMANGKRFSRSTGTRDRRQAEKRLEEFTAPFRLESERRTLETVAQRIEGVSAEIRAWEEQRPALRLEYAFEAYRNSTSRPDAGARTLAGYEGYFNGFKEWIETNRPNVTEARAVTAADAEAYAAQFLETHSPGTFNKHLTFLKCLWRELIDGDDTRAEDADRPERLKAKIVDNPWIRIRTRKHMPHSRRELTVEELAKVCAAASGEMRLLLALGIYTGLRLGDCVLLEWGNVDLVRGVVSVVPKKTARRTGKRVVVPLHRVLAGMLEEIPKRRRTGYLLPELASAYRRHGSLVTGRVRRLFESCGIKTGKADKKTERKIVDVGFHSLRHTFVSLSANAGAPMAVVQSLVGHGSPAMTRHYFHESEGALRKVVAALPDVSADGSAKSAKATGEDRLADFRAMVDAMSGEDLELAAKYLAKVRKARLRG